MKTTVAAVIALAMLSAANAADIVRHPSPGSPPFPIARAVEVPAGYRVIYHSGLTPTPADPKAKEGTPQYWGDTKTQSLSVLNRMKDSLKSMGLGFGDVVKMTVFLAGDPAKDGRMDFAGFMEAYSQFFGTREQPNLPARSTVQVASLVQPGMMIEMEVILAKPGP
jgi:enamine deaminase RidA (YjgF/YER057c/UK114 family)